MGKREERRGKERKEKGEGKERKEHRQSRAAPGGWCHQAGRCEQGVRGERPWAASQARPLAGDAASGGVAG